MKAFTDQTPGEIAQWLVGLGEPAKRAKILTLNLGKVFYGQNLDHFHGLGSFPEISQKLRHRLKESFYLPRLKILKRERSTDGTQKFLFELVDHHRIETVLIPDVGRKKGKRALCISTQVGCAMGCTFCLTGKSGLIRNLKCWEIVEQVREVWRIMGETMTHIIFMGMGEPLHNLQEVLKAIEILSSASGVQIPQRKMTVSTSGLLPQLKELAEKTQVLLALTLSAPNDSIRSQIMPVNRKYNLRTTRQTLQELPLRKRRKIFIEYVLLEKINDEITHAEELADLLQDIPCKINLIPFNAIPGFPYSRPSEDRIMAFLKILKKNGLCVSIRKQRGQDILSACGQLSNASFKESPILKNYPTTNI